MTKEVQILVLDDEENILNSMQRIFINAPFGVAVTSDYHEALEILGKEDIKVVLSDYRMPEIRGTDFLKQVKDEYPDIVRILFTGYADFAAAEEAINIGKVYRFISKPWDVEEFKSTVEQAIEYFDLVRDNKSLLDETQKKNEELEISNRKLNASYEVQKEFTSTVSHELRTPLASIKTAIDIVIKRTVGDINEQQEDVLNRARRNVDRLKRLVDDILDLSKIESGKMQMTFVLNDLNKVIQEFLDTQKNIAEERGLYLKTEFDAALPPVPLDSDRIVQVLNNLVGNALKFTKEGGITVKTENRASDNHVLVSVIDTGKGIAEEDMHKLFHKFQQIESAHANEEGGTGLGLVICKEIVSRHGGKIWAKSQPEQGTTFSFVLPVKERRLANG